MFNIKINPYAGVYKRAIELFESGQYNEAYSKFEEYTLSKGENP